MSHAARVGFRFVAIAVAIATFSVPVHSQQTRLPNPYRLVAGWPSLPKSMNGGRWGELIRADLDPKGNIWVFHRCFNTVPAGAATCVWKQFGRPSAVFVSKDDTLYVSDSQSNSKVNPGATRGITVGSATDGSLRAFIPDPDLDQADVNRISGASGITADAMGTIYAADVGTHKLRKYVKVK